MIGTAEQLQFPFGREKQSCQYFHYRGLACSVGTDQSADVSALHGQAEIVQDFLLFVGLAKPCNGNYAITHSASPFRFTITILTDKGKEKVKRMVKKRLSYKTIAHSPYCFDILVIRIELFEFLTDIAHVDFYRVIVGEIVLSPHAFKEIGF